MEFVEPESHVYLVTFEQPVHSLQVFAVLTEEVDVFAHYFAPLAQLLGRFFAIDERGFLVALVRLKVGEAIDAEVLLFLSLLVSIPSKANQLLRDCIKAASNALASLSFSLLDLSLQRQAIAHLHQLLHQLHLQLQLLVQQLRALLEDSSEEGTRVLHAEFSDNVGDDLPLAEQDFHCLLLPDAFLGDRIVGQLHVLEALRGACFALEAAEADFFVRPAWLLRGFAEDVLGDYKEIVDSAERLREEVFGGVEDEQMEVRGNF